MAQLSRDECDQKRWRDLMVQRICRIEAMIFLMVVLHIISFTNHLRLTNIKTNDTSEVAMQYFEHIISPNLEKRITEKVLMDVQLIQSEKNKDGEVKEVLVSPGKASFRNSSVIFDRESHQNTGDTKISNSTISRMLKITPLHPMGENNRCHLKPSLSPINHVSNFLFNDFMEKKLEVIHALSDMKLINDFQSPQYLAACYLLFDDEVEISLENEEIVQRYSMAVFFYATKQFEQFPIPESVCDVNDNRIKCDSDGMIRRINWGMAGLSGTIPYELSHLRLLEYLDLSGNNFEGTIPPEFGRLKHLSHLYLSQNNITGSLPRTIGSMHNLKELSVNTTNIQGTIPSLIGNCKELRRLDLSHNVLEGTIPPELCNCTKLNEIWLNFNRLTGTIPTSIDQLQHLRIIKWEHNSLSGSIPSQMGNISSLEWLILDNNKFTGSIPNELKNLESIAWIHLNANFLTGSIPDMFQTMPNLTDLYMAHNQLSGSIPDSIWALESIFRLLLDNNDLTGSVPDDFCSKVDNRLTVDSLVWFRDEPKVKCECCGALSGCHSWGFMFSHEFCPSQNTYNINFYQQMNFTNLLSNITNSILVGEQFSSLDVCLSPVGCYSISTLRGPKEEKEESNLLQYFASDQLPVSQNSPNLNECPVVDICGTSFDMHHPKRTGLSHITQLVAPDMTTTQNPVHEVVCWIMTEDKLYDNYSICDGTLIQRYVLMLLYVSCNLEIDMEELASIHTCQWPGVLCDPFDKFVEHLRLPGRLLHGTLISEIGLLTSQLKTFDLSNNTLSGSLHPGVYSNMPKMEEFNIGSNRFEGKLPIRLMDMQTLKELNMSHNNFADTLPNNFECSKQLESFDVGDNLLHGTMSASLFSCTELRLLDVSKNNFGGNLPSSFDKLENLKTLKLQGNRFSGVIPVSIFTLFELEELMLQSNLLRGSIPTQIGYLNQSRIITMSHNSFQGTIPTEFENLKKLEMLHLHDNRLTGIAPRISFSVLELNSYISDCEDPSFLLAKELVCETCSMCCNSEKKCQQNRKMSTPLNALAFMAAFGVPIYFLFQHGVVTKLRKKGILSLIEDKRDPLTLYQNDSVYCFMYTTSITAITIDIATTLIQIGLLSLYLSASNLLNKKSDWQFSFNCPRNSLTCIDTNTVSLMGWIIFVFMTFFHLGKDVSLGILKIRKSLSSHTKRVGYTMFLTGFRLLCLTSLAIFTSVYYNIAFSEKDTDLVMNAVILLFINDLDERLLQVLETLAPVWTKSRLDEIEELLSKELVIPVSRIRDGRRMLGITDNGRQRS